MLAATSSTKTSTEQNRLVANDRKPALFRLSFFLRAFILPSEAGTAEPASTPGEENLSFLVATKSKFQAIRGTRDLLPPETALWNRVEGTAREVFGTFGFGEIRPPILEPTELFARAVGGDTDIVSKEMYTFEDRPGELPDFKRGEYNFVQAVADVTKLFETEQIPHSGLNEVLVKFLGAKVKKYEALNEKLQAPNLSSESTQEILEEFKKI